MIAAGLRIERVPFSTWAEELRRRLEALPAPIRRATPLPVIELWQRPIGGPPLRMDTTAFRSRMSGLLGLDRVPSLDAGYIARCISALSTRSP
jgi:hypothetical protein